MDVWCYQVCTALSYARVRTLLSYAWGVYGLIVRTVRTLLSYAWGVYGLLYARCVRSLSERYRTHGAYVKDFFCYLIADPR